MPGAGDDRRTDGGSMTSNRTSRTIVALTLLILGVAGLLLQVAPSASASSRSPAEAPTAIDRSTETR